MMVLVVDLFAGGGGASLGLEWAGLPVDIAVNHDPEAILMHRINHPHTKHFQENIRDIEPLKATAGRPVSLLWASPDCKHFSKAKGAALADRNIRSLAWVVFKWAKLTRPRVIILENVEEFQDWGPVISGRPDPRRKGLTFNAWIKALQNLGYVVDLRELRACDYGAPTIRKRLFVIARCDGLPIVWPAPTHGPRPGLNPYRTAAECIDFSIPTPSIFLSKEEARRLWKEHGIKVNRPLAENTLKRIARGLKRFVLDNPKPFIVNLTHGGRLEPVDEPLRTVTAAHRGEKAVVAPYIATYYGPKKDDEFRGCGLDDPIPTQTTENRHALVAPFLMRHFGQSVGGSVDDPTPTITAGGGGKTALMMPFLAQHNTGSVGHAAIKPISTITVRGTQQQLVAANLVKLRGTCRHGQQMDLPFPTITAGGTHLAKVRAFLVKYYGPGVGQRLTEPLHTATSRARFGLVTVEGADYQIVDIGMRMLQPRELFQAQGFPDSYIINPVYNGRRLTKTAQIRLCGNSVCPQWVEALARANVVDSRAATTAA